MRARTFLAFDLGERKIGVAVGQSATHTSQGIATVAVRRGEPDWQAIERLMAQWRPDELVVGLPLHMDRSESPMSASARAFARALGRRFGLDVRLWDERLTSDAADKVLLAGASDGRRGSKKRTQRRDQIAAELILQSFMDETRARTS